MKDNLQMEPSMGQLTFASTFSAQAIPSAVIKSEPIPMVSQPIKQESNTFHGDGPTYFAVKILEKRECILELQKQIEDSEEEIINQEQEEGDFDPEKGEEDLFDVVVPAIESDLYGLRVENEIEIKLLEEEIVQLEKKK